MEFKYAANLLFEKWLFLSKTPVCSIGGHTQPSKSGTFKENQQNELMKIREETSLIWEKSLKIVEIGEIFSAIHIKIKKNEGCTRNKGKIFSYLSLNQQFLQFKGKIFSYFMDLRPPL
ncbi:hypothetical protein [Bacillus sp. AK031]